MKEILVLYSDLQNAWKYEPSLSNMENCNLLRKCSLWMILNLRNTVRGKSNVEHVSRIIYHTECTKIMDLMSGADCILDILFLFIHVCGCFPDSVMFWKRSMSSNFLSPT